MKKTEKHYHHVVSYFLKIMNTKTKEEQWLSLNGESQEIEIIPPRGEYVLTTILPKIGGDCENPEQALEEVMFSFNRDFADLHLKAVECSRFKLLTS